MLAVAGAAAAAAIAATSGGGTKGRRVVVAVSPLRAAPPPAPRPSQTTSTKGKPKPKPTALISWPRTSGYTIILASLPLSGGGAQARKRALTALKDGLRHVGVLVSSSYPSLHPGYYIVFSGVYQSLEDAQAALPDARRHFRTAYPSPIVR